MNHLNSNINRVALSQTHAPHAQPARVRAVLGRVAGAGCKWVRGLLPTPTLGNPLHEAWSADGEPLARTTPAALAQSSPTRHLILPMNRGQ